MLPFIVLYHSAVCIKFVLRGFDFFFVAILLHEHEDMRPGVQSANMRRPWCSGITVLVNCRDYHGMSTHFTQIYVLSVLHSRNFVCLCDIFINLPKHVMLLVPNF